MYKRDPSGLLIHICSGVAVFLSVLTCSDVLAQPLELVSPNEQERGALGLSVSGIADVDGDGIGDVVVGAPHEDVAGATEAGRAYVMSGSDGALLHSLVSPNLQDYGHFGSRTDSVPDVDGDGRPDLVVGAWSEDSTPSLQDTGKAYVFSGSTGILIHELVSPHEQSFFGSFPFSSWVAGVPDLTGDGRGDIAIAAPRENETVPPHDSRGRVYVFDGVSGNLIHMLASPYEEGAWENFFGISVEGVPDINGDGLGEIIVGDALGDAGGTPDYAGRVYLFDGSTGELLQEILSPHEQERGVFGDAVGWTPDVNGDGLNEIIVGAPSEAPRNNPEANGIVHLFDGATRTLLLELVSPNQEESSGFGSHVSGIPDVNGDGRGDVLVGASGEEPGDSPRQAGRAYVFDGATGLLLREFVSPNEEEWGEFGCSVSAVPDANGDGISDVIVGARVESPGSSPWGAGRAYIFHSPLQSANISSEPGSVVFPDWPVFNQACPSQTVTIRNDGTVDLLFTGVGIDLTGIDNTDFAITNDPAITVLPPGGTREINVAFRPTSLGEKRASLTVRTNDPQGPTFAVLLRGTGTERNSSAESWRLYR
jgi:HYDIN/CFA65/VesB family protein/FG-GAP repeat protein